MDEQSREVARSDRLHLSATLLGVGVFTLILGGFLTFRAVGWSAPENTKSEVAAAAPVVAPKWFIIMDGERTADSYFTQEECNAANRRAAEHAIQEASDQYNSDSRTGAIVGSYPVMMLARERAYETVQKIRRLYANSRCVLPR